MSAVASECGSKAVAHLSRVSPVWIRNPTCEQCLLPERTALGRRRDEGLVPPLMPDKPKDEAHERVPRSAPSAQLPSGPTIDGKRCGVLQDLQGLTKTLELNSLETPLLLMDGFGKRELP